MELRKGTLLQGGKYKIVKKLGQGSFGITYLATAKFTTEGALGKMDVTAKVAIKEFFMSDINGRKEDGSTVEGSTGSIFTNYKKRFRKEAENLSKLLHPYIVKVFDIFDENNTTYYVMEYLSDTNLNKYIIEKNGLPEKECIQLTEKIGEALQYMHKALMLHLDLKPGNIMLRNGEPVLIDFGLSKQFNANGQPETSTTIGQGTSGYAPLEQQNYSGDQTNGLPFTMDVYAIGGTMFKMITGQTPPDASSIFNDGLPKKELTIRKVSERLVNVIERAMSPSKKQRYQSVSELLSALNPNKVASKEQFISNASSQFNSNKSEDLTELNHTVSSMEEIISGTKAALKENSIIKSPKGNAYVVDYVFFGGFNFTYFCHYINNPDKRVVVRELFFRDYNCRKNGIVTFLGDVDWIERYRYRFIEFANILKTLSGHPNLENYVDSFKTNGTYYIVTEFISGETLNDLQNRQKRNFTEKEVICIIKQICTGLSYMMTHNILHLDIKPSNIMKSSNRYILLDFGLSKDQNIDETSDSNIGYTPNYSSLEQQTGSGKLTPASDIYSLGATMYKLLTGLAPRSATDILQDGFQGMESELKKNNVSIDLIKVIKIAMSPSIKNRYQSPDSLSKALSTIKSESSGKDQQKMNHSLQRDLKKSNTNSPRTKYSEECITKPINDLNSDKNIFTQTNENKNSDTDGRPFWVVVHLLIVGIMLSCFLCEHVYRGCLTNSSDEFPNTFIQTISQAVYSGRTEGAYGSIMLLVVGLFFLLQITWNKKTRTFTSFCGAIIIGMSSFICDLFGRCNYDNMLWILFLLLSIASSWCISICTTKTTK